jgi:hypothetical protein
MFESQSGNRLEFAAYFHDKNGCAGVVSDCSVKLRRCYLLIFCLLFLVPISTTYAAVIAPGSKPSREVYRKPTQVWVRDGGIVCLVANCIDLATGQPKATTGAHIETRNLSYERDDPSIGRILSGRASYQFDPAEEIIAAGWFGEFGVNPLFPAPPVGSGASVDDVPLLQHMANANMVSSQFSVDQTIGFLKYEFDWGPSGFEPTLNLDAFGHFNFFGIVSFRADGASSSLAPIGTSQDIQILGVNAPTYMQCQSQLAASQLGSAFFCGVGEAVPMPEPSTWALMIVSLALVGPLLRRWG